MPRPNLRFWPFRLRLGLLHQAVELGLQGGAIDLVAVEELAQGGEFLSDEDGFQGMYSVSSTLLRSARIRVEKKVPPGRRQRR